MLNKKIITILSIGCAFCVLTGFKNCPTEQLPNVKAVYEDNQAMTYIIGDSRIYFMRESLEDASDFNWIAVCGSGFYHVQNEFTSILNEEDLEGKTIIIESGLNDLLFGGGTENALKNYRDFYNNTAQEFIKRGAKVWMVRLLPVMPWSEHNLQTNEMIAKYNDDLLSVMPSNVGVIDLNELELGYVDELHFDDATSIRLYKALKKFKAKKKKEKKTDIRNSAVNSVIGTVKNNIIEDRKKKRRLIPLGDGKYRLIYDYSNN